MQLWETVTHAGWTSHRDSEKLRGRIQILSQWQKKHITLCLSFPKL